jgi:hypothetical protein
MAGEWSRHSTIREELVLFVEMMERSTRFIAQQSSTEPERSLSV